MKQVFTSQGTITGTTTRWTNPLCPILDQTGDGDLQARCPIAAPGTLRNLQVQNATAPTTGRSRQYTVFVNGSATSITCTLNAGETSAADLSNSVSVSAGDLISLRQVQSGGSDGVAGIGQTRLEFEADDPNTTVYGWGGNDFIRGIGISDPSYYGLPGGSAADGQTENQLSSVVGVAGTITVSYVKVRAVATASAGHIFTIFHNETKQDGSGGSVDTGVTVPIDSADTVVSKSFSLPVSPRDRLSMEVTSFGSPGASRAAGSFAFVSDDPNEQLVASSHGLVPAAGVNYFIPHGVTNFTGTGTETSVEHRGGVTPLHLGGMYVRLSGPISASGSMLFTLRKNGADTPVQVLFPIGDGGQTEGTFAGDDMVTINDGDTWSIQSTPSGSPSQRFAKITFLYTTLPPAQLRVTQQVLFLTVARGPDPAPPEEPPGGGEVEPGIDPEPGLILCPHPPDPVAFIDFTPSGQGSPELTYRLSKAAINRVVPDKPWIANFGSVRRALTTRKGGELRGSVMDILINDTERFFRGLEESNSLMGAVVSAYISTERELALNELGGGDPPRRIFTGTVTDAEPVAPLQFRLRVSDFLQELLDRPQATMFPQRTFTLDDFPEMGNNPDDLFNPGNPAMLNKPVAIGFGLLSDEDLGLFSVGVVPAVYTQQRVYEGEQWDEYICFCHAAGPVLGISGSDTNGGRIKFGMDMEGVDFRLPGHSLPLFADINGHRYYRFFARGPRSFDARTNRIPFALNVAGIEDVGDGTGTMVDSLPMQFCHLLVQFVLQNYETGVWLPIPIVNGYSRVKTASFDAVRQSTETKIANGHLGAWILGANGEAVTFQEIVRKAWRAKLDLGVNADGQIIGSMVDQEIAPVRHVIDIPDVVRETFHQKRQRLEAISRVTWRFNKTYVPGITRPTPLVDDPLPPTLRQPQGDYLYDNLLTTNPPALAKYGIRELDLPLDTVRDIPTAIHIVDLHLAIHAGGQGQSGPMENGYKEGLCGTLVELGDNIILDHYELPALGDANRLMRCEAHTVDLDEFSVEFEHLDLGVQEET